MTNRPGYDEITDRTVNLWRECLELRDKKILSDKQQDILTLVTNLLSISMDTLLCDEVEATIIDEKLGNGEDHTAYVFEQIEEALGLEPDEFRGAGYY